MMQPVILIRIGYGYIVVRIGPGEVICILIIGLALFHPIFAAHLQDDKCRLAFSRFLELRVQGNSRWRHTNTSRRRRTTTKDNFTREKAEAIAEREGLVLVPSKMNATGYKGVCVYAKNYQARCCAILIGTYTTSHEAALNYARHIGPQQAAAEKAAEEAAEKAAKAAAATFEEAKATAESEGLVLVPSKASATGYRGVSKSYTMTLAGPRLSGYQAKFKRGTDKVIHIGTYTTSHEAALHYARHIGPQQAAAEKAAEERGKKR